MDLSSLFSSINALFKITNVREVKAFAHNPSKSDLFSAVRDELNQNPHLAHYILTVNPNINKESGDFISQCLTWVWSLVVALTQLPGQTQLSVSQEQSAQKLLSLLVALGVRPNLLPVLQVKEIKNDATNPALKHQRLVVSLALLLRIGFASVLGAGFFQRHLLDVLSALCQLCYAPIRKVSSQNIEENPVAISSDALENGTPANFHELFARVADVEEETLCAERLTCEMHSDRRVLLRQLAKLETFMYQPLLVQTVLTLQNLKRKSCPSWLRSCCGQMLTSVLLRPPSGLVSVLQGMLQDMPPSSSTIPDMVTARIGAVAQLLCQTPAQCMSTKEYLSIIGPQILQLLSAKDPTSEQAMYRVACTLMANLHVSQPDLAREYLFQPLLAPLTNLLDEETVQLHSNNLLLPSDELEDSIQTIHKVFENSDMNSGVLYQPLLLPISRLLLRLASACGISHLRTCTVELLKTNISYMESETALDWFESMLEVSPSSFTFQRTSSGSMQAVKQPNERWETVDLLSLESYSETIWILLQENRELQPAFFIRLLQLVVRESYGRKESSASVVFLFLLEKMTETIKPEHLMKDLDQAVQVLQTMLSHCLMTTEEKNVSSVVSQNNIETPLLAFTILDLLLQNNKLTTTEWQHFQSLLPTLEQLSGHESLTESSRQLSQQLRVTIATRGVVVAPPSGSGKDLKEEETFECAWRNLVDPEVAFKCHGLVLLRRLLNRKDLETLKHKQIILDTLRHDHLLHQDSCVYQSCVQTLVALAFSFPNDVLPVLFHTYANVNVLEETRLKVAEALVQICRQRPSVLSRQGQAELLTSFLGVCRQHTLMLKLSALSCLGEICQVMRFDVQFQLQEVLLCLVSFLQFEDDVNLKRAAAMALTHFLRGLGKDIFQVLKEDLRDVHRALLHSKNKETDERLLIHLELALEEIKEAILMSLQESTVLQKHIHILEPL